MGEKYCDDGPGLRFEGRTNLDLRRIANPIGEGYPPASMPTILGGGAQGLAALVPEMDRPAATTRDLVARATETFRGAGDDAAARLGAVQTVTGQLGVGQPVVEKQLAQADAVFRSVVDRNVYTPEERSGVLRDAGRGLTAAARDLTAFQQAVQDALAVVEDRAKAAVGDRFDAAVNRFGQVAHRHTARLYEYLSREQPGDAAEAGGSAA